MVRCRRFFEDPPGPLKLNDTAPGQRKRTEALIAVRYESVTIPLGGHCYIARARLGPHRGQRSKTLTLPSHVFNSTVRCIIVLFKLLKCSIAQIIYQAVVITATISMMTDWRLPATAATATAAASGEAATTEAATPTATWGTETTV